jgi:hypothetical protein
MEHLLSGQMWVSLQYFCTEFEIHIWLKIYEKNIIIIIIYCFRKNNFPSAELHINVNYLVETAR